MIAFEILVNWRGLKVADADADQLCPACCEASVKARAVVLSFHGCPEKSVSARPAGLTLRGDQAPPSE